MSKPHREVLHTEVNDVAETYTDVTTEIELGDNVLHVQIDADNESGSVTDALAIGVFPLTDDADASGNEDTEPASSFLFLPTGIGSERTSFQVADWAKVIIKVKSNGATDEYTVIARTKLIPRRP